MISVDEAKRLILEALPVLGAKRIALRSAIGLYLAEDISAPFDLPRFSSSAMDGFALNSRDAVSASEKNPIFFPIVGEARAGRDVRYRLQKCLRVRKGDRLRRGLSPFKGVKHNPEPGTFGNGTASTASTGTASTAIRIMTGAPLPPGTDAVVMQEKVELSENGILVNRPLSQGENVRWKGEDIQKGEQILKQGARLGACELALLASFGFGRVLVNPHPRVVLIVTGDELAPLSKKNLKDSEIYDTNSVMIRALLGELGRLPFKVMKARDEKKDLSDKLKRALEADCILLTGGVSVGKYDLVKTVLESLGVRQIFWKIAMKPGKPVFFGKKEEKMIFGLPGNPASAFVAFQILVRPALLRMMGHPEVELPRKKVALERDISDPGGRVHFIRGIVRPEENRLLARPSGPQGSHCMRSLVKANCFIVLNGTKTKYLRGEEVDAILFEQKEILESP